MLLCSPAGNDLLYDDSLPEQGRNFANKIWNAFRLIRHWKADDNIPQPEASAAAVKWMEQVLKHSIHEIDLNFRKFRISEALMITYKLFWDEFSAWYLEIIKPAYQKPVDRATLEATISILDRLLRIIHPFMPFITEEIWQMLADRKNGESIMVSLLPEARKYDKELIAEFEVVKEIVSAIRTFRKENNIAVREEIEVNIKTSGKEWDPQHLAVIIKLCNLSGISFVPEKIPGAASFMVNTTEFFIPLAGSVDIAAELQKLQEDLDYNKGFLASVLKKLENERFVQNAPSPVLELERKKKSDAEARIRAIEERIKELQGA
jgi:valyl-tRNA synthetase